MKKILSLFNLENIKNNLRDIFSRFPVSGVIIIIIASLFFTELHFNNDISEVINDKIFISIASLIITFFFSLSVYLSSENTQKTKLQINILQIIPIVFGILFYFVFNININNFENFIFFFLSFTGIVSYLFFAPYLKNIFKSHVKQGVFYSYFYNIYVVILTSFILGLVLFALGAIGIGAVDALFELNISEAKTYGNWAILSLGIIAPLFSLSQIPSKKSFSENNFNQNAFFSFLTKYITIPFIYLYFFILYAYSIKVLVNFSDWPKGEVSWMVIGFSIFGYITYIFSYVFEEKNNFIRTFRKLFPGVVIPQIFMLFYAIYLRINQYDITINRYFVVVFGLWLAVISIYYIASKKKYLHIIPAILTLFTIIISLGPWGVYSLPESRQLARLENNLIKANILNNNKITPLRDYNQISQDLSKNIYSGIDYLCDFDSCNEIKKLFPKIYKKILEKDKKDFEGIKNKDIENYKKDPKKYSYLKNTETRKYREPNSWSIVAGITEVIKVKNYFSEYSDNKYIRYSKNYNQSFFPLEIKDYSKLYKITKDKPNGTLDYVSYDADSETIKVIKNNKTINTISTTDISKQLIEKYDGNSKSNLDKKDLIFEIKDSEKIYKLYFDEISVKNPEYSKNQQENYIPYYYVDGYLLVKQVSQ